MSKPWKSEKKDCFRCRQADFRRLAHRVMPSGMHLCDEHPILIHKFEITQGEHDGEQLNALDSKSPVELAYFSREQNGELGVEHGAAQRRRENREKRRKPAAKPARPADPRYQPFADFAHRAFQVKYGAKPSWQGKDWKGLQNLLASNKSVGMDDLQTRWQNYLASTELFTVKQGGSLAYFCAHADSFIAGPIFEKGGSNGKTAVDPNQRSRDNLRAAGLLPN